MNIIEQIYKVSPWLTIRTWAGEDRHLSLARSSGIRFRHLDPDVSFTPDTVNIIRGPRQIGKTTECKLIVEHELGCGKSPNQYIYFPCDNLLHRRELADVVDAARSISKPGPDRPLTLLLDEITSVKEWPPGYSGRFCEKS